MRAPKARIDTRAAFLDAAEQLFAQHGYEGMRIRDIATAAGANLSALHYYWGSKDALIRELCERRIRPVMEERLRLFHALEQAPAGDRRQRIAALLRAHLTPFAQLLKGPKREVYQGFYTRMVADPSPVVRAISSELMEEMSREFVRLLRPMCDHIDDEEFFWRLNGVLGTVLHAQAFNFRVRRHVPSLPDAMDLASGIDAIAAFLTAGLIAPPARQG